MLSTAEWDEYWRECRAYAEDEFESTIAMRRARGQSNPARIKHQTAVGKMGELLAWNWLCGMGYDCSAPDFAIYRGSRKSWESDMFIEHGGVRHKVACKSQDMESARRYGRSWIFQKGSSGGGAGGAGHTDPVISRGDSLSVFVSVDLANRDCEVLGPFDMSDLRPLFKPPKLDWLKRSKVALYWDDMVEVPMREL